MLAAARVAVVVVVVMVDGAAVPRAFWQADSVQEKRAQVKSLLVEDCRSSCR